MNERNIEVKYKHLLKIPTCREAYQLAIYTVWPRILTWDYPETNPYSGQRVDFNPRSLHCKSAPLTTRPRRMERYTIKTNLHGFPGGLS